MGTSTPEDHAGRSAELQRLLDEADDKPARRRPARPAAAAGAKTIGHGTGAVPPAGRTPVERSTPGAAADLTSSASKRSPLRSSPSATSPRKPAPAGRKLADSPNGGAQRRSEPQGDPAGRLRRSALVRSSIGGPGARRVLRDSNADQAGAGRARGGAGLAGARAAGRTVSPATKTAVARSLAGRWGPAGFSPVLPERRAAVDVPFLSQDSGRRAPMTDPATAEAPLTGQSSIALPPTARPRQRRTLVLAGGAAAAVVAIFAIVSLGNRGGLGPAADSTPAPDRVAMVQSTGADGAPTVMTVTAPVSTVNGAVVALVPDADGRLRQLAVVTETPPAAATRTATTTAAPQSGSRPAGGGAATTSAAPTTPSASTSPAASTTPTPTTRPATPTVTPTTARPAPADPGDVATVVTGLTKLTGWVPLTTG